MLRTLAVANYRSLRNLVVPLTGLEVVTGANGSGKSSLYRSLVLLADCARGEVIGALAREGGLDSTLWAGPDGPGKSVRSGAHPPQGTAAGKGPVRLKLGFTGDDFGYLIELGMPVPIRGNTPSAFNKDPEIKYEAIWAGVDKRPSTILVERENMLVRSRSDRDWVMLTDCLRPHESMLSELTDPIRAPELLELREQIRRWRFYDTFRTDADAPARQSRIGTRTPVLSPDGFDLAAAMQTIIEVGDGKGLAAAVADAFPGSLLEIDISTTRFEVQLTQHGMLRPFGTAELSEGTLRYLLWIAALLTPRPPGLMVLNEPETSLHADLLPALARLIAAAAARTQVVVVSHSALLIAELERAGAIHRTELIKEFGQTSVMDLAYLDQPSWHWS